MSTRSLASLCPEVLQHIALFAADLSCGPPANLLALRLTCRSIHWALASPYLYDRIFRLKFDIHAPQRRLGPHITTSSVLAAELRKRCCTLRRIRRRNFYGPHVRDDLWVAYLMMLENDGRNAAQLVDYAQIEGFLLLFLDLRLQEGCESNGGWPLETEANALAVWLLWLTTDEDKICNEPWSARRNILRMLQPFVVSDFKYQPLLIPDTHFYLPLVGNPQTNPPRSSHTIHGPYPIYRAPLPAGTPTLEHFGLPMTACAPPLVPAALLASFARREQNPLQAPPGCPAARADRAPGTCGVTAEDCAEFNARARTRCIPRAARPPCPQGKHAPGFSSADHDHEWLRITRCFNPWLDAKLKLRIFTPGMLDGCWDGRLFAFDFGEYAQLLGMARMPADLGAFPRVFQHPLQMRLREQHCVPPGLPAPCGGDGHGGDGDGLANAYFARGTAFREAHGALAVRDPDGGERLTYETFARGRPNSHAAAGGCAACRPDAGAVLRARYERVFCEEGLGDLDDIACDGCVKDIVVTGETDCEHGLAWGFYKFFGRVRDTDGLVVIIRIPDVFNTLGAGSYIFRGYIHSNQNFCGRWRAAADAPDQLSAVTGSFSLCKRAP